MRIGLFSDSYIEKNGVTRMLKDLRTGLTSNGHETIVFAGRGGDYELHGIPFLLYPDYSIAFPNFVKTALLSKMKGIDIVHAHSPFSLGLCAIATKKLLNLPSIATFHTLLPEYVSYFLGKPGTLLKEPGWKYMKSVYNQFDVVVCPSKSVAKILAEKGITRG